MSQIGDIREYKTRLRQKYRTERKKLSPAQKTMLDGDIFKRFLRLNQYDNTKTLLTYVSTPLEVDTRALIKKALADGKSVGVPRCIPGTRDMAFFYINSLEELNPGAFGVLEPEEDEQKRVVDFRESICIVPAFCFDNTGYRLGYGKGYYDRFLSGYSGIKIGICYSSGVRSHLFHGRFDCAVDLIVTERYIRTTELRSYRKNTL